MLIKGITDENFTDYKKTSMFIATPYCSLKCDRENGTSICQNARLPKEKNIEIDIDNLIQRYIENPITKAIVFGGLEPFDSFEDLTLFIKKLRNEYHNEDDVVIYTGYKEEEIEDQIEQLRMELGTGAVNIIVKFGRFIPDQEQHLDEVLGVQLYGKQQYAKRIF